MAPSLWRLCTVLCHLVLRAAVFLSAVTPQPTAEPDCDCGEGGLSSRLQITIAAVVGLSVVVVLLGIFVFAVVKLVKFIKSTKKMK